MNNVGASASTSNFNTVSITKKFNDVLALMYENTVETTPTVPPKEIDAATFDKLKTIAALSAKSMRAQEELKLCEQAPEQAVTPIPERLPTHLAVAALERRRTHSVAPLLMARAPTQNFDLIDSYTIRQPSAKEAKLKQEKARLEQQLAKLKEIEALQLQILDLMQDFLNSKKYEL